MNLKHLYQRLTNTPARRWLDTLPNQVETALDPQRHGRLQGWLSTVDQLPNIKAQHINLSSSAIEIGSTEEVDEETKKHIKTQLQDLIPWRKGPYSIFGTYIDTEWRSDWKWDRLVPHITPLKDRWVLDVGCGSGYHCWRMLGEKAEQVVGIDPTLLFNVQFEAVKRFTHNTPVDMLPLPLEALPENLCLFDTVFSMGVLYHRRSPIEHLLQLRDALTPGGELILETLTVDGPDGYSLVPDDRYAKMRNVWFLPTLGTLEQWMKRCQFENIRVVDTNTTSIEEQRTTPWMPTESLIDTLSAKNRQFTVEGLPRPTRSIIIANRKN